MARLGELEAAVMGYLWELQRPVGVRAVLEHLNQERALAYTTVMTVLDNLHRKGMVTREMAGRAYAYRASTSRQAYTADLIEGILAQTDDRTVPLLHFVQRLSPEEMARLRAALDPGSDAVGGQSAGQGPDPSRRRRRSS